jgi:hypothetical protein
MLRINAALERIFFQARAPLFINCRKKRCKASKSNHVRTYSTTTSLLYLLKNTITAQRKALLSTITKQQLKALSQIAYNILRFKKRITPSEKKQLKRQRRVIHLLGNRSIGFNEKKRLHSA